MAPAISLRQGPTLHNSARVSNARVSNARVESAESQALTMHQIDPGPLKGHVMLGTSVPLHGASTIIPQG